MRNKIALGALVVGLAATAASAQQLIPIYPVVPPIFALPPYEIVALVRSTGLEPLSRPLRYGPTYGLRAVDPVAGQEVHVVVDARLGRVVRIIPILSPGVAVPAMPPHYVRLPGRVADVADEYHPSSRAVAPFPGAEKPRLTSPAGPPLPRPRPKIAATNVPAGPMTPATSEGSAAAPAALAAAPIATTPASASEGQKETPGTVTAPATVPMPAELDE